MNLELNKKNILLICIFAILAIFLVFLLTNKKDDNNSFNSTETQEKYSIVKNYNNFYTVNSCVFRYLSYLQIKDTNSLLKVLDEDFIDKNSINESNLYNFLTVYDGNINFSAKKMYEEKISDSMTKYYVYGYVEKDIMDSFPEKYDSYFIVILDSDEQIFTIQPYSGEIFK